ncbi:tryptophan synthase subunit alpha [Primorskyibacter sp. 2E107]|uniref:tryptophan synthase subunit alpha n=1 Tax=Primorskyibacter sp. 2E107 TaxID=3403458 RepID=UPI003AF6E078
MNHTPDFFRATPILSVPPVRTRKLCPLIMAGDPSLDVTRALLRHCAEAGIAMVELCLPFRNAFTDGKTLLQAHKRALSNEISAQSVIEMAAEFTDRIDIILLADSSHTLRPEGFERILGMAKRAGFAGVLPHGLPPALTARFDIAAKGAGLPQVGTIYANALPEVRQRVLGRAGAFIYLVSSYGRSGGSVDPADLTCQIEALRSHTDLPVALGFGLKTPRDVGRAFAAGADIAIVGSAISGVVEAALAAGLDPARETADFIDSLNRETRI